MLTTRKKAYTGYINRDTWPENKCILLKMNEGDSHGQELEYSTYGHELQSIPIHTIKDPYDFFKPGSIWEKRNTPLFKTIAYIVIHTSEFTYSCKTPNAH